MKDTYIFMTANDFFDYERFYDFDKVIEKAKMNCEHSGEKTVVLKVEAQLSLSAVKVEYPGGD